MFKFPIPFWAAEDGTGTPPAPPAGDPPPANPPGGANPPAPPAGNPPAPTAKWWDASDYSDEERQWLAARGLTEDDPVKAIPKMVKGHRAAEQRIGKGLDSIIDKPAQGQSYAEWAAANRAALGLPEKEDAYTAAPPEGWPKDAAWDAAFEAEARKVAFAQGVPPEAYKAFVGLYAQKVLALEQASVQGMAQAREGMMAELKRDFGEQTPAVITRAKQGLQFLAEKAGMSADQVTAAAQTMIDGVKGPDGKPGVGDANVIRLFAALHDALGEDSAVALGKGGPLTTTPVEARQRLAQMRSPEGEYSRAVKEGNRAEIARLQPEIDRLTKLAAG